MLGLQSALCRLPDHFVCLLPEAATRHSMYLSESGRAFHGTKKPLWDDKGNSPRRIAMNPFVDTPPREPAECVFRCVHFR